MNRIHTLFLVLLVVLAGCGGGDGRTSLSTPGVSPPAPRTAPGAPAVTSLIAGDAQVTVGFSPPASDGNLTISNYTVVASPGGQYATGSAGPFTVSGLTNGVAYTFTVTAANAVGAGPASAPSAIVTPTLPAPVAPAGVGASVAGTTITLMWGSLSRATSYNVYWGNAPGITTASNKIANITAATYQHAGLAPNTTYYYAITANFINGEGPISSEVNGFILPGGLSSTREVELNNNALSATPITIGSGEMRGQLSGDTDLDYYSISSTGGVVSFSLRPDPAVSEAGTVAATIYAPDGATVISSNDLSSSTSSPTQLTLSADTAAATYYLKINKSAGVIFLKDYLITSSYVSSTRESEPNNIVANASDITIGLGEMRGQLSGDADVDYYKVVSTGGVVSFTIKPDPAVSEAGTISAVILAQDGVTVLSANVLTSPASGSASLTLAANTTTGTTYYLKISKSGASSIFRKDYIITSDSN